jgi:AAA domain
MPDHPPASPPPYHARRLPELRATAVARTDWLWHGYLKPGGVTLLTGMWKAGKTTLVALLLHRMKAGGLLAGSDVAAGKVVVVSEEEHDLWDSRSRLLDLDDHVYFLCRPFGARPTAGEWCDLIGHLADLRREHGISLAVIDPLSAFLPGRDENTAPLMMEALLPLRSLTAAGMAVLLLHHPRKKASAPGMMARGSGALSAHVGIALELKTISDQAGDRRRRLMGFSRYAQTPTDRVIELTADGTDYLSLGDLAEQEFIRGWPLLRLVLTGAKDKLTRRQVLDEWPPDQSRPGDMTIWRWLDRAVERGLLLREGEGRKSEPHRFWLAEKEAIWSSDPLWMLRQQAEEGMKLLQQL